MLKYYRKRKAYLLNYKSSLSYTLQVLKTLELAAINNDSFNAFCESTFGNLSPEKIPLAVWTYILQNITYKNDQYDEVITSPDKTLEIKTGDCDDMALLAKSIFSSLGITSEYLLLGKKENEFTHILVVAYPPGHKFLVDGTNNVFNKYPDIYTFYKLIN